MKLFFCCKASGNNTPSKKVYGQAKPKLKNRVKEPEKPEVTLSPNLGENITFLSSEYSVGETKKDTERPAFLTSSPSFNMPREKMTNGVSSDQIPNSRKLLDCSQIITISAVGAKLSDSYVLHKTTLGEGSYGSVVRADDKTSGRVRAVKVIYKPDILNFGRLKREILIMKRLDHPNIVKLYEVFEEEDYLYLVMELCVGGELFDRISKAGFLKENLSAHIIKQLICALSYIDSIGIMHRDLKPENILLSDGSPYAFIKLIDWGFAARFEPRKKFTSIVGTPYYVAPEVAMGNYDSRCDMWSAGVILYVLLCGYPPFYATNNKDVLKLVQFGEYTFDEKYWGNISVEAKDLVKAMMTYNPNKRITPADALQHPFILKFSQMDNPAEIQLDTPIVDELLYRFKQFRESNRMKKLALICVAYQSGIHDYTLVHQIFVALDADGDGIVKISEAKSALETYATVSDGIEELLLNLDTSGRGVLSYTEFIAAALDPRLYQDLAVCQGAFSVFDLDGDQSITADEIITVLKRNFQDEPNLEEQVLAMVRDVDINGDGEVQFEEFVEMMQSGV